MKSLKSVNLVAVIMLMAVLVGCLGGCSGQIGAIDVQIDPPRSAAPDREPAAWVKSGGFSFKLNPIQLVEDTAVEVIHTGGAIVKAATTAFGP